MAQGSVQYSSLFEVVDSHVGPPRIGGPPQSAKMAQTLLLILVSMALFGMAIEAYFIYNLYHPGPECSGVKKKYNIFMCQYSGMCQRSCSTTKQPNPAVLPSKPVAHLNAKQKQAHGAQIMSWSTDKDNILYEMGYKDGKLAIQKEGYYYVYSRLFFTERSALSHYVKLYTPRYRGEAITLLQSSFHNSRRGHVVQSNSYLGGVFHLFKGDSIFVEVNNTSQIVLLWFTENKFGAYMI